MAKKKYSRNSFSKNLSARAEISLSMIVKNEENNLRACLDSIKSLVAEIVIVDTGSNDKTIAIAEEFDARVYFFNWCSDFSKARNYSLEKCTCPWILSLDADEIIDSKDISIIRKILQQLEAAKLVAKVETGVHRGRKVTKEGNTLLKKVAE